MNLLTKLFPTPSWVRVPAVGLDFSDTTMRFMSLELTTKGIIPKIHGEITIPEGVMKGGRIVDTEQFVSFLKQVQKKYKLTYVHVSIPESQVYSVTLALDKGAEANVKEAIELVLEDNIPLKVLEAVFDYHVLSVDSEHVMVQVVAVAESVARGYYDAFVAAGIIPVSFELEGQAVVRAVIDPKDTGSYMIVDFGAHRTGINIVTNGTVMTTATLDFGGRILTEQLAKEFGISLDEAEALKREHGLVGTGEHKKIFETLSTGMSVLKDEINRRYIYWHEKKNQFGSFPQIETIYLCGGHSNLRGLDEYLSNSLKLKVAQVNPWKNCFSLDRVIPSITKEESMSYVTALGLALADYIYD